jgi:DNA (cytosine-5)-methyltransferase 1
MGYHRAGFDVVGVDIKPQPNYPFECVVDDALDYLEGQIFDRFLPFDAIHASPPCQAYSVLGSSYDRSKHSDLVDRTRALLQRAGLPYVIENVPGSPLVNPVQLCGSSFGLGVRRHRLFECSFPIMVPPCNHASQRPKYRIYEHGKWSISPVVRVFGDPGGKAAEHWNDAMGIDWMTRKEIVQTIPPAYTQYVGEQLLAVAG